MTSTRRVALLTLLGLTAAGYAWNIGSMPVHNYYAATVRSMSGSWRAFFYGTLDPAGALTVDKIPGALWPQALSVRLFGFSNWALILPQVIAAVLTVLVLYLAVRRWAGESAGLVAAVCYASTPIVAALAKSQIPDTLMVLFLVLAADACLRAVESGRLRHLLASGLWVELAFHVKMAQAWLVLPAFAAVYLVAAPGELRRRAGHVAATAGMTLVVSSLWVGILLLAPGRPYIESTRDDNPLTMVFGYNGLARFGVPTDDVVIGGLAQLADGRATGPLTLLTDRMAPQAGWLYPLAALALVVGLAWRRGFPRTDLPRAGLLLWGGWLAVHVPVLSFVRLPHNHYLVALAPALAALSGYGVITFYRAYREGGARAYALPAAIVATVAWSAWLALRLPSFLDWTVWLAIVLGLAALVVLGIRRFAVAGAVLGLIAMLVTPAAWAASTNTALHNRNGVGPAVGPVRDFTFPGVGVGVQPVSREQRAVLNHVRGNGSAGKHEIAVAGLKHATPLIVHERSTVLVMGGFSGITPFPRPDRFQQMVRDGQVRFVHSDKSGVPPKSVGAANVDWAAKNCQAVEGLPLYDCAPTSERSSAGPG